MATPRRGADLESLDTLLRGGSAAGLTDGQLLEQFATRGGEQAAELAFASLVGRHGPMVLRTCRAVLRDEHDAQDAFQATFLVLARRGATLWVRDSVGPWLHRVACRAAIRSRRGEERRAVVERRAAEMARRTPVGPGREGIGGTVNEEVDRLPERYRVAVVLCDLEGRTHEEVARHLGCPVGTVKSRLARGRERLRDRLTRRGLAPGSALLGASRAEGVRGSVPEALAEGTVRAAIQGGTAPATVVAITEGVLRAMFLTHLKTASLRLAVGTSMALVVLATGAGLLAQQPPRAKTPSAPAAEGKAVTPPAGTAGAYAWRRTDRYEPPDFERFFPDDVEGGKRLEALFESDAKEKPPTREALRIVRQGLRKTEADRSEILAWVGGACIWGASPQDPDAVEILYHAADFRGRLASNPYGTRYNAVYYGLSVVQPKPPAVLRTLVDMCMQSDCDWERAGWGARSQRADLLSYLKPYLDSADGPTREKAAVVAKFFNDDPDAGAAALEWRWKTAWAKYKDQLPGLEKALREGNSRERLAALRSIEWAGIGQIMDGSVAAFAACAEDKDEKVRSQVAQVVGMLVHSWYWRTQKTDAIDFLLRLSNDPSREVRYDVVYHGMTPPLPPARRADIVRRLVTIALEDRRPDMIQRIQWILGNDRDEAAKVLDAAIRGPDPAKAEAARSLYKDLAGRTPPGVDKAGPEARKGYAKAFRDLHAHLGAVYPNFRLKGIDWDRVGRELLPRGDAAETEEQFGRLVEEMVARLEDSHAAVLAGSATPPNPGLPEWDPGLASLIDDRGRPVLYTVGPRTPAWKAGVRPGMTIVSVNGVPAAEAMDRWMDRQRTYVGYSSDRALRYDAARLFHRQDERGAKVTLVLEEVDGNRRTVGLTADSRGWYIPRLPVPRPGIDDGGVDVSWVMLEGRIGYIYVRRIRQRLGTSLDQALSALGVMKGLILDVRGNSGGGFDAETSFRAFDPSSAESGRPRYIGPIALLIDERCISAGEVWASWFVARKRARLFGTTTSGASARKETYPLSNGLYQVVVPVRAYTGFLDRPIERRGLEPDVEVRCTAADVARGRDTVAEAAIRWLTTRE